MVLLNYGYNSLFVYNPSNNNFRFIFLPIKTKKMKCFLLLTKI